MAVALPAAMSDAVLGGFSEIFMGRFFEVCEQGMEVGRLPPYCVLSVCDNVWT